MKTKIFGIVLATETGGYISPVFEIRITEGDDV